jgi:hypothetical protein
MPLHQVVGKKVIVHVLVVLVRANDIADFIAPGDVAATFHLTEAQIAAAARYIEEHRDEVMVVHRQIEDRKARGSPPEILAKAAKSRAKLQEWLTHYHETNT